MTESREKAIRRTKNLAYWFMGEMLKEEERGEKEKEAFEKAKETGEWQLAGINAMFDQCNKENMVPYDMPTAIKGLLCMQYQ